MYYVQSVLFDKKLFSVPEAIQWLRKYKYLFNDIDEKKGYYHFRQINPQLLEQKGLTNYHNKKLSNSGIILVLAYPVGGMLSHDSIINNLPKSLHLYPVGSYARGESRINDIDLITWHNLDDVIDYFYKQYGIKEIMADGPKYKSFKLPNGLELNIWIIKRKNLLLTKYLRTIPQGKQIGLKKLARKKGYKLTNEELLDQYGDPIKITSITMFRRLIGVKNP